MSSLEPVAQIDFSSTVVAVTLVVTVGVTLYNISSHVAVAVLDGGEGRAACWSSILLFLSTLSSIFSRFSLILHLGHILVEPDAEKKRLLQLGWEHLRKGILGRSCPHFRADVRDERVRGLISEVDVILKKQHEMVETFMRGK